MLIEYKMLQFVFSGAPVLKFASGAKKHLETASHPQIQCYLILFRAFVAFCICVKIDIANVSKF